MSRDLILDLHPAFQPVARAVLADAQVDVEKLSPGSIVRPAVTFRETAAQLAAKAAGLSHVSIGWHQYGLAVDAAVIAPGGSYVSDGKDPRYAIVGAAAKRHGCIWGGDWHDPDWDHFEWHPGFTLAIYQAWLREHPAPAVAA